MNKERTEIVVLMDASGSMQSIREDAVGGFNAFVDDQKKEDGAANLTVIFFDSNRFAKWQDGIDLRDCPVLGAEYVPGTSTPLLDATGRTIEELGARLAGMDEAERPGRVMVIVLTDGHENASRFFTKERVKELIRHQEEVYKWEFVFLAANVDAFAEGAAMGFKPDNVAGFTSSKKGTRAAFLAMSESAKAYRRGLGVRDLGRQIGEDECGSTAGEMGSSGLEPSQMVRRVPLRELPANHRSWTGNDSSARCHHGVVPAGEDTVYLELRWKSSAKAPERLVGGFAVDVRRLVREGYLAEESSGGIRLKFLHGPDGRVYVGRGMTKEKIAIGRV